MQGLSAPTASACHPSPLAGPPAQLLGPHPQSQMSSCIPSCSHGDAPGSCGYLWMNGSDSPVSQLHILVTIGRERPSVYHPSPLLSIAKDLQQPVPTNPDDGNGALFQHQQVLDPGAREESRSHPLKKTSAIFTRIQRAFLRMNICD